MSNQRQAGSRHLPADQVQPAYSASCPNGHTYLTRNGGPCPQCAAPGDLRRSDGEFTKKVVDDNDLIKGS